MEDFILGSSHEWEFEPMLQEHLGTAYEIVNILKPSAPLGNVTEKLADLGNGLTKWDHIIRLINKKINQEIAWIEITVTQLNRTSASLLRGHVTQISDL